MIRRLTYPRYARPHSSLPPITPLFTKPDSSNPVIHPYASVRRFWPGVGWVGGGGRDGAAACLRRECAALCQRAICPCGRPTFGQSPPLWYSGSSPDQGIVDADRLPSKCEAHLKITLSGLPPTPFSEYVRPSCHSALPIRQGQCYREEECDCEPTTCTRSGPCPGRELGL